MKTKSIITIAAMLIAGSMTARAQEYVIIHPVLDDGKPVEVPLTADTKLSFTSEGFTVGDKSAEETRKFNYADVAKITFGAGTTGIEGITDISTGLTLAENPVGDILVINGHDSLSPVALDIHAMNGSNLLHINGWTSEPVDVSRLTPGLYFVTINSKTLKFIKK